MTRLWRIAAPAILIAGSLLSAAPASADQADYTCESVTLIPSGIGNFGIGGSCVAGPGMPTTGPIDFFSFTMSGTTGGTISCEHGDADAYPIIVSGVVCTQVNY
jgi:hypothetical protein